MKNATAAPELTDAETIAAYLAAYDAAHPSWAKPEVIPAGPGNPGWFKIVVFGVAGRAMSIRDLASETGKLTRGRK